MTIYPKNIFLGRIEYITEKDDIGFRDLLLLTHILTGRYTYILLLLSTDVIL